MFTYSPLSREKRETRFFRFSSACQPGSHLISLQLCHASLDDDALQYRALSYVWGDSKGQVDIEINGKQFSVGENLHAFLQMLQHHDVESWLWADAICIQQSDDDEKSWHVQNMYDIFKNAELVYSWLGRGSKETDVAMEFFADWGPRAVKLPVMEKLWPTEFLMDASFCLRWCVSLYLKRLTRFFLPEPVFDKGGTNEDASSEACEGYDYDMARFFYDLLHVEGLRGTRSKSVLSDLETGITHLLTNQYWQRIWIFQEVALAREVHLMCGEKLIPISYFEAVLEALWKFRVGPREPFLNDCPLRRGFCERFSPHLYPNKAMFTRQLLCRGETVSLGTLLVAFSMSHGHSTLNLTKLLRSRTAWTQALLYGWMPQATRPYSPSTLGISLEMAGGLLRGVRRPPAATPTSAELLAAGTAYPNFPRCHRAREPTTKVPKILKDHHKTILVILGTTIANQARSRVPG